MKGPTVFIKPGRLRARLRRHPWIYGDSVERVEGEYENGQAVVVRAPDGRFVAHAFVNDQSRLFLRLVSFEKARPLDAVLLQQRVRDAVALRREVLGLDDQTGYRVIHSEGDGIPGLIVDRYRDVLVLGLSSLGTAGLLEPILDALEECLSPRAIVASDVGAKLREKEGLPEPPTFWRGSLDEGEELAASLGGVELAMPWLQAQKTGLYLDQRDNVARVAELAAGRRVLDACCYVGAFGIAAAKGGAESVECFDQSGPACAQAEENARRNGVGAQVQVTRASLYRQLRELADREQQYSLIVLDPPKFSPQARDRDKARKGYLEANQLAMRLLSSGGLLFSCSCSHHMDEQGLEDVLREAANRTRVELRVLERRGAGPDHPTDVHCPEGRYLKGLLVQRRG